MKKFFNLMLERRWDGGRASATRRRWRVSG